MVMISIALEWSLDRTNHIFLFIGQVIQSKKKKKRQTHETELTWFVPGADTNPQTLLFSATCPPWVYDVAKKYMRPQYVHVDLIGKKTQKTATTVEVSFDV